MMSQAAAWQNTDPFSFLPRTQRVISPIFGSISRKAGAQILGPKADPSSLRALSIAALSREPWHAASRGPYFHCVSQSYWIDASL